MFIIYIKVNVRVLTMDSELEFAIQPNTTGKQLFDQVRYILVESDKKSRENGSNLMQTVISVC